VGLYWYRQENQTMQDHLLIKKCQGKDPAAQRHLFDKFYRYVYTIAFRYLKNHHDCEDTVSIIFSKVFKNIGKVDKVENQGLKRWIQTIAINESLRFLQKKNPIIYTEDIDQLDQMETELVIEERFSVKHIKLLIEKMPEGYRRVFLLHTIEGLSHSEIAQFLNISRNTSKSQMIKARKHLQSQIKKYESEKIR